jgi:hypothetical protein
MPGRKFSIKHIALRCQLAHPLLAVSIAQLEGDETLVAQDTGRIERLAVDTLAHGANRVTLGRLVLDYLGAEVGRATASLGRPTARDSA